MKFVGEIAFALNESMALSTRVWKSPNIVSAFTAVGTSSVLANNMLIEATVWATELRASLPISVLCTCWKFVKIEFRSVGSVSLKLPGPLEFTRSSSANCRFRASKFSSVASSWANSLSTVGKRMPIWALTL